MFDLIFPITNLNSFMHLYSFCLEKKSSFHRVSFLVKDSIYHAIDGMIDDDDI
jgi:hypothetical protein